MLHFSCDDKSAPAREKSSEESVEVVEHDNMTAVVEVLSIRA